MTWWGRSKPSANGQRPDPERERRLADAEQEAAALWERAEAVGSSLRARLARNHWAEGIAAIARREQP